MIKAEIWSGERATLYGPFPFPFIKLVNALAGRKHWNSLNSVKIEATPANIRFLQASDYQIEFIDKTGQLTEQEALQSLPTQHAAPQELPGDYQPGIAFYDHQKRALALSWEREFYALLFEMGLGKTAIVIANSGMLFRAGSLTGVLVLAPKGPHRQWTEEEIPKHLDKRIRWNGTLWKASKKIPEFRLINGTLQFFVMNSDAIRTKSGYAAAQAFLKLHGGKSMLVADESHDFKTQSSNRTEALMALRELAAFRRIASGTPIAKNIADAWSQFNFLDNRIIGHKYFSSFRARYCVTRANDPRTIVGQKNTEEFYSLIAPHCFRLTKNEALDLPPKIYVTREYEMSAETDRHYQDIKETLLTELRDGTLVDAVNPAVALLRLQQIVCGHLPGEGGVIHRIGGERIEMLADIVDQTEGPTVVWARFIEDRRAIVEALTAAGESVAVYAGSDSERTAARDDFLGGRKRIFLSNQKTGGVGLNLQGKCQNVIYFSNSFSALERWQSEDRTHRIGTLGAVTYFDIVARRSVDKTILRNLKVKKDLASLTLDDIRQAIISDE